MESTKAEIESNFTLTQHIIACQRTHPEATGNFSTLLHAIGMASKFVSSKVRQAGLTDLYGVEGTTNVQGEVVKKLDVIANDAFITAMKRSCTVSLIVSEEDDDPIVVGSGEYVVAMDPLDGSSNIDVNISIGTIFGIYKTKKDLPCASLKQVLRPGNELCAAGYTMYGSATQLVLTIKGEGVNGFTLSPDIGEFVLSHPDMKIPIRRSIYSVNEGNFKYWTKEVQDYITDLKNLEKPYSHRYVGSMVADVHRTLIYGGIFLYPADKKSKKGKLRLLYEANPMSLLVEEAGGLATDGNTRILNLLPENIHDRTGVILGSKEEVEKVLTYTKGTAK